MGKLVSRSFIKLNFNFGLYFGRPMTGRNDFLFTNNT